MNRRASPCFMNQKAINKPTAMRIVTIVSQSFLAHHNVSRKQTPRTILATLLATMLKPQKISKPPIRLDPRYPAGRVMNCFPPRMWVKGER